MKKAQAAIFGQTALPELDLAVALTKNEIYFITGQNNKLGDDLTRFVCYMLKSQGVKDVSCFCPQERRAYYTKFLPPAWVCDLTEEGLRRVFAEQQKSMQFCDELGADPNERVKLREKCARLLIIDRAQYFNKKDNVAQWPVLNNGLMHCRENNITVIFRNICDRSWESVVPTQILHSEHAACFIVSCVSPDHLKEAKRFFGGIRFQSMPFTECLETLSTEALFPERGVCAVISKRPVVAAAGSSSATSSAALLEERYSNYFAKFTVPQGNTGDFKFGDPKLWQNYAPRRPGSTASSSTAGTEAAAPAGFDAGLLNVLNLLSDGQKLRISVAPNPLSSKAPKK